jgi:PAS domain S-box-containing protein
MIVASLIIILLTVIYLRQKQLLKEKSLVEALFLGVGEGLVACDKNEKIIYSNNQASDLVGYSKKELFNKKYYDYFKMVDHKGKLIAREKRLFVQAILSKKIINVSLIDNNFLLKKDGTRFSFAGTVSPIIVDEKVEGVIVIFRNANKEKRVDRMKTEFLSLATHQLLTPVSSIKWMSELLLGDKELGKKKKSHVSDIYISAERMRSLINSLLNISRIESGRIMVEPKSTDLRDLVSELIKELKIKSKRKNIL